MEIMSRFIESEELGRIHVVSFEPQDSKPAERAVFFNSFKGRVTTIDGFAIPYEYARQSGVVTDFVERPGTGLSTLPENNGLRRDFNRYGFIAVREALADAQLSDLRFKLAEKIHGGGFSLGGHAAMMYLETVSDRASSAVLIDPAGLCNVLRPVGTSRFFAYAGVETLAGAAKIKPQVEQLFNREKEILKAFREFTESVNLPAPSKRTKEYTLSELKEVTWPNKGKALKSISRVMHKSASDGRDFEFKAYVSGMRIVTDHRSIAATNSMLDEFDSSFPGQKTVGYGFLRDRDLPWWHDLSVDPEVLRRLIWSPVECLRKRLSYFR